MATVEPRHYRNAIGGFATGVSVVTAALPDGTLEGMTANSLTSVSLDPTLLAVCFKRGGRTLGIIEETRAFVVNLLSSEQEPTSNGFARKDGDPWAETPYALSEAGIPILDGGVGYFECKVHDILEGGDHVIVLGEVQACEERDGSPLLYFKGSYRRLTGAETE